MFFRKLKENEIDLRVATIKDKGLSLLLYKDARCDMNILDETVGAYNWRREHTRDNANCIVSIWDKDKGQWISKEDTGTESYTEKEKGLASDSFKRACFNWGIGRELYTSPFIWVSAEKCEIKEINGKKTTYDKFSVQEIAYDDQGNISKLVIKNQDNVQVFSWTFKAKETDKPKSEKPKSSKFPDDFEILPCEECGLIFERQTHKGKVYTEREIYELAKQNSPDGRALCKGCREKLTANESEN